MIPRRLRPFGALLLWALMFVVFASGIITILDAIPIENVVVDWLALGAAAAMATSVAWGWLRGVRDPMARPSPPRRQIVIMSVVAVVGAVVIIARRDGRDWWDTALAAVLAGAFQLLLEWLRRRHVARS